MGEIHKIGDEYYVEFMARGLKYQQKAGSDRGKAEELLRQIEEKISRGELQTIVRDIDLGIFFAEFLKWAQSQYHPQTVRRLSLAVAHFDRFLNEKLPEVKKLSQITPRVIEEYKAAHMSRRSAGVTLNPKIINLTLLLIREVLEYGIKTGYINDNPTLHIRLLDVKSSPQKLCLSSEDFTRLLSVSSETVRPALTFMRYTGLRLRELERLTWQGVDWNRQVIFVKNRDVPLNSQALGILKAAFHHVIDHKAAIFKDEEGRSVAPAEIEVRFAKGLNRAGMRGVGIGILRHSFACDLFVKGIPLLSVGKILGVNDPAKLMVYASVIPASRQDIFKGVFGA